MMFQKYLETSSLSTLYAAKYRANIPLNHCPRLKIEIKVCRGSPRPSPIKRFMMVNIGL